MAERPTPHSIGVCTLIALHSDPSSPLHDIDLKEPQTLLLHRVLEDCVIIGSSSIGNNNNSHHKSLVPWMRSLARLELSVYQLVLDTLHRASESMSALDDLMESLRLSISEGLVDEVSAHGVYLRQVSLGWEELSFESMAMLWQALKQQVQQVVVLSSSSQDEQEDPYPDTTTTTCIDDDDDTSTWPLSPAQLERQLRKECHLHEQGGSSSMTTKSYEETELEIRNVIQQHSELPAAYFLRFMNCVTHGERVGALDALHQYFDVCLCQHHQESSSSSDILQFAAILLASTHRAFGDYGFALLATDEAVRVAQQSKDAACVAFALGWIYQNNNNNNNNTGGGELLERCAKRASQGQLPTLVAGANLSLAQRLSHQPGVAPDGPSQAWNALLQASTENKNESTLPTTLDRPTHLTEKSQGMETLARQRLVAAGIWDAFQLPQLSGISSFVALHCHDHLVSTDVWTAIHNVARVALYGSPSKLLSTPTTSNKESSSSSSSCIYATCLRTLVELREKYKLGGTNLDNLFVLNAALVLHEWAVRRGDLQDAQALGVVLESSLHPRLPNYTQVKVDIYLQKCLLLSRQGHWQEAKDMARELLDTCQEHGLQTHRVRLLIQLAWIQLESNPHKFIAALPPLLEAVNLCEQWNLDGLHATCLMLMAKIFLRLGNPKRAIAILHATLPSLLRQEHVWYQSEAYLVLAKCQLQLAKTQGKNNSKRLRAASKDLQNSRNGFQTCQDTHRLRETLYLQARVADALGDNAQRDAASAQFVKVQKYMTTRSSSKPSAVLDSMVSPDRLEQIASRSIPVSAGAF
jgi:tetratricopeptide (TPR) repeat protein